MTEKPDPRDYFLTPQNFSDHQRFRGAIRSSRGLELLVDGQEIFASMERSVLAAKSSILLAFWSFDPLMPLFTKESKDKGLKNWQELLFDRAQRKVKVRVLITDFDPVFKFEFHAGVWARYRRLVHHAAKEKLDKDSFQVVCARHEAEVSATVIKSGPLSVVYGVVAKAINEKPLEVRRMLFAQAPGLWDKYTWGKDNKVSEKNKDRAYPVFPATHHQKLIFVDGKVGYVGGVNLIPVNFDSRKHDTAGLKLFWHDAFIKLGGSALRDIRRHFVGVWNHERIRSENFLKNANKQSTATNMPIGATNDLAEKDAPMSRPDAKKRKVLSQVHRTITKNGGLISLADVVRNDVLEGYEKAIELANNYIYVENQYLRDVRIADMIIKRFNKQKRLQVIIVLPSVAEEMIAGTADFVSMHGAALQFEALERLSMALGRNLGLFSMARPSDGKMIYVHSKLLLIDDVYGNIGSANLNPRSFNLDTELNFAWYDPATVTKFRMSLWAELLGQPPGLAKWDPPNFMTQWRTIANRNRKVGPKARKGFIIPFENTEKGKKSPLVPDDLASVLQSDQDLSAIA